MWKSNIRRNQQPSGSVQTALFADGLKTPVLEEGLKTPVFPFDEPPKNVPKKPEGLLLSNQGYQSLYSQVPIMIESQKIQ